MTDLLRPALALALLGGALTASAAHAQPATGTGNPVGARDPLGTPATPTAGAIAPAMAPASPEPTPAGDPLVGRIIDIEGHHGYVVAQFPAGRMNVSVDKRELSQYKVGDLIRIDSSGRPQPRATPR